LAQVKMARGELLPARMPTISAPVHGVSRVDALVALASRLGYALRKAFPALRGGDRELFLGPVADILEDIGLALKPVGWHSNDLSIMPSRHKPILELFSALATRSGLFGWSPPDIAHNVSHVEMSLARIDAFHMIDSDDTSELTIATTAPCMSSCDMPADFYLDGPVATEFAAFDAEWIDCIGRVTAAFTSLDASWTAALVPLPPLAPLPCAAPGASPEPAGDAAAAAASACAHARLLASRILVCDLAHDCVFLIQIDQAPVSYGIRFIIVEARSHDTVTDLSVAIEDRLSYELRLPPTHALQFIFDYDDILVDDSVLADAVHANIFTGMVMYCIDDPPD